MPRVDKGKFKGIKIMINKITLKKVACFKEATSLDTDKKVNLIYGLNGTGKSTFSEFLRNIVSHDEKFSNCSIETDNSEDNMKLSSDEQILVYNEKWVKENFYQSPTLKGIFSLSQGNATAKGNIDKANEEKARLDILKKSKEDEKNNSQNDFNRKKTTAVNAIWQIKKDYTGGERNTDHFFTGLKGNSEVLFNFVHGLPKPQTAPSKSIDDIKKELSALLDNNVTRINPLKGVIFTGLSEQDFNLLKKEIVGSNNSTFSTLVEQLKNSDWVNAGLKYVESQQEPAYCPFCQQQINKEHIISELKACFDKSYEQDKQNLQIIYEKYNQQIDNIVEDTAFTQNDLLKDLSGSYNVALLNFRSALNNNLAIIESKLNTPSKPVELASVEIEFNNLNAIIKSANDRINEFNLKIEKKDEVLKSLKNIFWENIRLQYDTVLVNFESDKTAFENEQQNIGKEISEIVKKIKEQDKIITEQSKLVSNIEDAVANINNRLLELGIDSFYIIKYDEEKAEYKLVRSNEEDDNIFDSLSEGEKMIISFLYFIEECKGKEDSKSTNKRKIIIIDDPISSLSHIFVFNVGTLIKEEFFLSSKKYEQIFVLTHNLYFFYELAKAPYKEIKRLKEEEQEKEHKKEFHLFRIVKNSKGSSFVPMKYSEIQNDYQMYWSVVNDENSQPALIANCMRNIIDYFFGFIRNNALNEVFQKKEFKGNIKFQAFYRYINRESHSDNINIYDMKDFDYASFHEAFQEVFKLAGFEEHYNKMSKIGS